MTKRAKNIVLIVVIVLLAGFLGWYAERAIDAIAPWPAEPVPPSHLQRCYCRQCKASRAAQYEADRAADAAATQPAKEQGEQNGGGK